MARVGGDDGVATTVKVIVLGNGSAGKTSVCNRLKEDGFAPVYRQTVGIDWHEKSMILRGRPVLLQLHDIGGQSLSSAMLPQYIAGVDLIFLLYDVTDAQSFRDLSDWATMATRHARPAVAATRLGGDSSMAAPPSPATQPTRPPPRVYLLGNKVDIQHLRKVTRAQHDAFIAERGLQGGFLVSAKTGESVLTAFYTAAAEHLGMELTPEELELTAKVIGVSMVRGGGDEALREGASELEKEDAAAEARKRGGGGASGGCCCVQ